MALMTGIDLDRAFAIPVLHVAEYPDLSAMQLSEELGAFHPLQGRMCGWASIPGCRRSVEGRFGDAGPPDDGASPMMSRAIPMGAQCRINRRFRMPTAVLIRWHYRTW
jgi:hypothetical protein